ncbi:MAG: SURF1 family protein [Pseudomonadota bacterium]
MTTEDRSPRPFWVDGLMLGFAGMVFITLVLLGNWQMRRLAWKLDLIETVNTRLNTDAVAAPVRVETSEDLTYRRVMATGELQHDRSRQVKALTELGAGYWLMTPLKTVDGHIWINRGFTPLGSVSTEWTSPSGLVDIEGVVRASEPGGTFLETNDPQAGRWFSRDVAALSADSRTSNPAPYFIDADHYGADTDWPRGGMTIVKFRNAHLSYALTWYAMAVLFLGALIWIVRDRLT